MIGWRNEILSIKAYQATAIKDHKYLLLSPIGTANAPYARGLSLSSVFSVRIAELGARQHLLGVADSAWRSFLFFISFVFSFSSPHLPRPLLFFFLLACTLSVLHYKIFSQAQISC
ncbi:hypothetical protein BDY21DRAFT_76248 [Lineolata rhizophorae]|uniref:Uncharacterized protein n=1 Tax=Lineolata rhizophorae TaxID=578093 RepID=A0A6A6NU72_9PEZI|nr:hypothetical protein BDY21DRAFT_76248 [Lineolata rhizophorae]